MPKPGSAVRWIDHNWQAIEDILPRLTMDWYYQEDGADRLKHNRWMLTRPTFLEVARKLHRDLLPNGVMLIRSVSEGHGFPDGKQRALALRMFYRVQRRNGAEVAGFLFATACELIGTTPFCAYQEPALREWVAQALAEEVPNFGNVYNLLLNVLAQTMLWILGCLPYAALQRQIESSVHVSSTDNYRDGLTRSPFDDPMDAKRRVLLHDYTQTIYHQLTRIGQRSPVPRTYHESETH